MGRTRNPGRRLEWITRIHGALRSLSPWPARLGPAIIMIASSVAPGAAEVSRAEVEAADEPPKVAPAPASPPRLEVIVRDKGTGKPIEGASIRPAIYPRRFLRQTDRDGRARIILFQHYPREDLYIDVWAEGYVQQRHIFSQTDARYPKIPGRLTVELLPGEQTLGGTVNDEQGRPIKGVKVEIWGYLGEKKRKEELAYHVDAVTDEQGRWRCRCFRAMRFAHLYLSHPDYVTDDYYHARRHGRPIPSEPGEPGERPLQTLVDFTDVQVMTRGARLVGEVRDEQRRPVEGAEVAWFVADKSFPRLLDDFTTTTDGRGRFQFAHARPGKLMLQVKAKGHAPELAPVELKLVANPQPVLIRLGPPHQLGGRVVDTAGKPIADALVQISTWRTSQSLGVFFFTDADGQFRLDDAPADQVEILVRRTGFDSSFTRVVTADLENILILRRSLMITGRIRDAATGEAIDQFEVEVGYPDAKAGGFRWVPRPALSGTQGTLWADVDVEQTHEFRLRIRTDGFEPFESRTFRSDERQVEYDIAMRRTGRPQGTSVP